MQVHQVDEDYCPTRLESGAGAFSAGSFLVPGEECTSGLAYFLHVQNESRRRHAMRAKIMLTVGFALVFAGISGYGQQPPITAKIDFPFNVEGKVLPAGQYEFTLDNTANVVRVQGESKNVAVAPILTRISGAMHVNPREAYLVFDEVGETNLLSEIWSPAEDGYLVLATKGSHSHKVVHAK
jgi:hypothetical protein